MSLQVSALDNQTSEALGCCTKLTKLMSGNENKLYFYPIGGIATMQECVDREMLWRAHKCKPTIYPKVQLFQNHNPTPGTPHH